MRTQAKEEIVEREAAAAVVVGAANIPEAAVGRGAAARMTDTPVA